MNQQKRLAARLPKKMIDVIPAGPKRPAASYLAHYHVRQLLLYILGGYDWSIERTGTESGDPDDPYWVVGRLTVTVDGERRTVEGLGTGSNLKNAESDAIKRAASNLGVGLELWAKGGDSYWLDTQWAKDGEE